jgi:hypothetical protein
MSDSHSISAQGLEGIEFQISPVAAAILEFTSDLQRPKRPELIYITSKDAFAWAVLASVIAENKILPSDLEITSAIYNFIASNPFTINPSPPQFIMQDTRFHVAANLSNQAFADYLLNYLLTHFAGMSAASPNAIVSFNTRMRDGYRFLHETGLITDPIIETILGLAILPFVPFSIVKRTKNGRVVHRKIRAALWKYERAKRAGVVETNLTFEAARIAKVIKCSLVAGWHEATKDEGDEPDEHDEGEAQ